MKVVIFKNDKVYKDVPVEIPYKKNDCRKVCTDAANNIINKIVEPEKAKAYMVFSTNKVNTALRALDQYEKLKHKEVADFLELDKDNKYQNRLHTYLRFFN